MIRRPNLFSSLVVVVRCAPVFGLSSCAAQKVATDRRRRRLPRFPFFLFVFRGPLHGQRSLSPTGHMACTRRLNGRLPFLFFPPFCSHAPSVSWSIRGACLSSEAPTPLFWGPVGRDCVMLRRNPMRPRQSQPPSSSFRSHLFFSRGLPCCPTLPRGRERERERAT